MCKNLVHMCTRSAHTRTNHPDMVHLCTRFARSRANRPDMVHLCTRSAHTRTNHPDLVHLCTRSAHTRTNHPNLVHLCTRSAHYARQLPRSGAYVHQIRPLRAPTAPIWCICAPDPPIRAPTTPIWCICAPDPPITRANCPDLVHLCTRSAHYARQPPRSGAFVHQIRPLRAPTAPIWCICAPDPPITRANRPDMVHMCTRFARSRANRPDLVHLCTKKRGTRLFQVPLTLHAYCDSSKLPV